METIWKQLDKNEDITDARVFKVLQKRKKRYKPWDDDERGKFIEAVRKYGRKPSLISMHVGTKSLQ